MLLGATRFCRISAVSESGSAWRCTARSCLPAPQHWFCGALSCPTSCSATITRSTSILVRMRKCVQLTAFTQTFLTPSMPRSCYTGVRLKIFANRNQDHIVISAPASRSAFSSGPSGLIASSSVSPRRETRRSWTSIPIVMSLDAASSEAAALTNVTQPITAKLLAFRYVIRCTRCVAVFSTPDDSLVIYQCGGNAWFRTAGFKRLPSSGEIREMTKRSSIQVLTGRLTGTDHSEWRSGASPSGART